MALIVEIALLVLVAAALYALLLCFYLVTIVILFREARTEINPPAPRRLGARRRLFRETRTEINPPAPRRLGARRRLF